MNQHVNPVKFRTDDYNLHRALANLRLRLSPVLVPDWVFDDSITELIEQVVHYTHQFDLTVLQHFFEHRYFNCTIDNPEHSEMAKMANECCSYYIKIRIALQFATFHPNFNSDIKYKERIEQAKLKFGKLIQFYSKPLSGYDTCGIPQLPSRGTLTKPAAYHEYDE